MGLCRKFHAASVCSNAFEAAFIEVDGGRRAFVNQVRQGR